MNRARLAIFPVIPNRRRFVSFLLLLLPLFTLAGYASMRLGYYPVRLMQLAGLARIGTSASVTQQFEVLPVSPPLSFLLFILFRNPMLISGLIGAVLIGYLVYYVTSYPNAPVLKVVLFTYILFSPSMLLLVLFEMEWAAFLTLGFFANYFVLEFYRQEHSFFLFMCGLCIGAMYLIVPEFLLFLPFLVFGLGFIFRRFGRTLIYSAVLLLPVLSAALLWPLVEWFVSGTLIYPFPRFSTSVAPEYLTTSFRESGPVIAGYVILLGLTLRTRSTMFRPAYAILGVPLVLLLSGLLWATPVPIMVQIPLFMVNLVILYPYLDMMMSRKVLRPAIIALTIIAGISGTHTLLDPPDSFRAEVGAVIRGEGGNMSEYELIMEQIGPGRLLLNPATVHFAWLLDDTATSDIHYRRFAGQAVPPDVQWIILNLPDQEPPGVPGFTERFRTVHYRVLERTTAVSAIYPL